MNDPGGGQERAPDHPSGRRQYRVGRHATPAGTQVQHSFEIDPDLHGADMGAEKGAGIIRNRNDAAGLYHLLGDCDSEILLALLAWEAFYDVTGSNPVEHRPVPRPLRIGLAQTDQRPTALVHARPARNPFRLSTVWCTRLCGSDPSHDL